MPQGTISGLGTRSQRGAGRAKGPGGFGRVCGGVAATIAGTRRPSSGRTRCPPGSAPPLSLPHTRVGVPVHFTPQKVVSARPLPPLPSPSPAGAGGSRRLAPVPLLVPPHPSLGRQAEEKRRAGIGTAAASPGRPRSQQPSPTWRLPAASPSAVRMRHLPPTHTRLSRLQRASLWSPPLRGRSTVKEIKRPFATLIARPACSMPGAFPEIVSIPRDFSPFPPSPRSQDHQVSMVCVRRSIPPGKSRRCVRRSIHPFSLYGACGALYDGLPALYSRRGRLSAASSVAARCGPGQLCGRGAEHGPHRRVPPHRAHHPFHTLSMGAGALPPAGRSLWRAAL